MFAEGIVGLLATVVTRPVATASYVSARRPDAGERHAPELTRSLRHAKALAGDSRSSPTTLPPPFGGLRR